MGSDPTPEAAGVNAALARVARLDAPRVLSVIAARFRDLDLADEAVQDSLVDAARAWPSAGVPTNPGAWLMTVAGRRAIDVYRGRQRAARRLNAAAMDLEEARRRSDAGGTHMIVEPDDGEIAQDADERLRLMLMCCHPSLHRDAQVALTLRLVAGLTVAEIGSAFLTSEATISQRIVRAKRKIRLAKLPLTMPAELEERLDVVMAVLYLVFNEGYLSHVDISDPIRPELVDEAIRLTELVTRLAPDSAEARGLLALERFHRARSAARFDVSSDLVLLSEQDRSLWDLPEISAANVLLHSALSLMQPGRFQIEALIAAEHANARTAAATDWPQIAALYAQLSAMTGSSVVALNHAVAVAEADGPLAGLARLAGIEGLDGYHLAWATRAELHRRAGHHDAARSAAERALALGPNPAERRRLDRLLCSLSTE